MTYIYIVEIEENANGQRTYVGITNDLHRRFNEEGRRGWLSRQTRIRMVYCDAKLYRGTPRSTEKWVKAWSQYSKLFLMDETFRGNGAGELAWKPFWHRCSHDTGCYVSSVCPICNNTGGVFD
jgi:predicted GIY-YIG superfamily endonuclease